MVLDPIGQAIEMDVGNQKPMVLRHRLDRDRPAREAPMHGRHTDDSDVRPHVDQGVELEVLQELERTRDSITGSVPVQEDVAGDDLVRREDDVDLLSILDQMLSTVAGMCILAYGLYTVAPDTVAKVGSDGLKWTLPFVLYGILRYLFLIHRRNVTGSPEKVLFSDVPTLVNLVLYTAAVFAVLYLVPH